jgi:hypothetical protein
VAKIEQAWSVLERRWAALTAEECGRIAGLVVERVDYDGAKGKVAITFHAPGIRQLAEELVLPKKEKNA